VSGTPTGGGPRRQTPAATVPGVRVAFVGKGGAGKSVLAGTTARLLARRGGRVLAVDSDPLPGLAVSLGLPCDDSPLPDDLVEEVPSDGRRSYRLRAGLPAAEAVERVAPLAPDGVRFLQFGKPRGAVAALARSQAAFRAVLDGLVDDPAWSLVGDLPGGTRQPYSGWGGYARTLLVVVEPSAASLLSARRLAGLAGMPSAPDVVAVANKVRDDADVGLLRRRCGLEVVAAVPYDEQVRAAEREGVALLDAASTAPTVAALGSLLTVLEAREVQP
jgi:CO dehydrogenase maturation factor